MTSIAEKNNRKDNIRVNINFNETKGISKSELVRISLPLNNNQLEEGLDELEEKSKKFSSSYIVWYLKGLTEAGLTI